MYKSGSRRLKVAARCILALSLAYFPPSVSAIATKRRPKNRSAPTRITALQGIIRGGPWTVPTYADSTVGDRVFGEDLRIRRIAVQSLRPYNGAVVVVDSSTGRVLSIVNQKLVLSSGFQPCSTIKISVALAALSERIIEPGDQIQLNGRRMNLTYALAHSHNLFFANLGRELGFGRVSYYAHQFGYGEKAGLNITGENAGHFPLVPPHNGGVSMLTSFGEEVSQTPLQLAALMAAVANGGTLYRLQYLNNADEIASFVPSIKRRLNLAEVSAQIIGGLRGAVEAGTARAARQSEPIAGKTGTCSENHAHLGWFGSFNNSGRKLVVVVLLRGGRQATGGRAASIAGNIYRQIGRKDRLDSQIGGRRVMAAPSAPGLAENLRDQSRSRERLASVKSALRPKCRAVNKACRSASKTSPQPASLARVN